MVLVLVLAAQGEAESISTRGLRFATKAALILCARSRGLPFPAREFLEDYAAEFLQFAEARQIFLKIVIQQLRILRPQLIPQDHVAQLHGVRQESFLTQFLERLTWIVVIHAISPGAFRHPSGRSSIGSIVRTKRSCELGSRRKAKAED